MIQIRQLRPIDAQVYRDLMLEAFRLHPEAFTTSYAERAQEPMHWWRARLSEQPSNTRRVFGAFDSNLLVGDVLVGFVGLAIEVGERTNHRALLFGMYVAPAFREHGIGTRLVEAVLQHAGSEPRLRTIRLTVSEQNRDALTLYKRLGFVEFGCEPMAVRHDDGFITKLHLYRPLSAPDDCRYLIGNAP